MAPAATTTARMVSPPRSGSHIAKKTVESEHSAAIERSMPPHRTTKVAPAARTTSGAEVRTAAVRLRWVRKSGSAMRQGGEQRDERDDRHERRDPLGGGRRAGDDGRLGRRVGDGVRDDGRGHTISLTRSRGVGLPPEGQETSVVARPSFITMIRSDMPIASSRLSASSTVATPLLASSRIRR